MATSEEDVTSVKLTVSVHKIATFEARAMSASKENCAWAPVDSPASFPQPVSRALLWWWLLLCVVVLRGRHKSVMVVLLLCCVVSCLFVHHAPCPSDDDVSMAEGHRTVKVSSAFVDQLASVTKRYASDLFGPGFSFFFLSLWFL
jgi:hypothetical protein